MTQTPDQTPPELTVAPEILGAVNQLRQRAELLVAEIGRMEVRKGAILSEITTLNEKASTLLRQEGERLGIPAGAEWQISPEGKVAVKEG